MSLRCHLFFSDANQGTNDFWCKKVGSRFFFCGPTDGKFLLEFCANCGKEYDLEVEVWGLGRIRGRWLKVKILS